MFVRRVEDTTRTLATTGWGAIAVGVAVTLALQTLLLSFGIAVGLSVGDETLGGGFQTWSTVVQLVSLGIGAALASRITQQTDSWSGTIVGVMTWAAAVVIGAVIGTVGIASSGDAWSSFFGVLLGLGAAMVGGSLVAAARTRSAEPQLG
jgi:hypothetical protein